MNNLSKSPLIGVSSWALHAELGSPAVFGVDAGDTVPERALAGAKLSLLELPEELAHLGFDTLQICHFHLPSRDPGYLADLKGAIHNAGLPLHALLVDAGDLTDPQNGERDESWTAGWLPVAAQLGARHVRIAAGRTAGEGAIARAAAALKTLATHAADLGITVITENWLNLLTTPAAVHEILDRTDGQVGLLLDFGNWTGPTVYEDLASIAPRASSCHAKANYTDSGELETLHYTRCLDLPYPEDFEGPFILVNGGLEGIGDLKKFIGDYAGNA